MTARHHRHHVLLLVSALLFALLTLSACAQLDFNGQDEAAAPAAAPADDAAAATSAESQPYYPTDFNDLLIPGELKWNRERSMAIRTDSFAGGILHFSGRVEINSLTDYFLSSMQKSGWKVIGSAKYKDNLLVFTKPAKTCMIHITEGEFSLKTEVYVYITENVGNDAQAPASGEEIFR